jgi:hypothetical protein
METLVVENSHHPSLEQASVQIRGLHGYDQRRIRQYLVTLLHDVTTSGKTQTLYDVDTKIATMGLIVWKNLK